jgi:choline transport protein
MTSLAWQSTITAECLIVSQLVQALARVWDPSYQATEWKGTLITMATVILVAAFVVFAAAHIRIAEGVFATCRMFAVVPLLVAFWVLVSPKATPRAVFLGFRDFSGTWPYTGVSALVGQVTGIFVNSRSNALAHLAEEVEDAAMVIPKGMVWSYVLVSLNTMLEWGEVLIGGNGQNAPLTFAVLLTFCFNIGSVRGALLSEHPFGRRAS